MSFKRYQVRPDLVIRAAIDKGQTRFLVSDPLNNLFFQVGFLQYQILKFFQESARLPQEAVVHLEDRCSVQVEESAIVAFLEKVREKAILEPDRSIKLAQRTRVLLGKSTKEYALSNLKTSKALYSEDPAFKDSLSDFLYHLRFGDVFSALEAFSNPFASTPDELYRQKVYLFLKEKLIKLQGDDVEKAMDIGMDTFTLTRPQGFLDRISGFIHAVYSKIGLIFFLGLVGLVCFILYRDSSFWFAQWFDHIMLLAAYLPLFFVAAWTSTIIHEYGHAMMCYRFGGQVRRMGILVLLKIAPMLFADVSDIYFMNRGQRILVLLGGVLIQMVLFCLGVIVVTVSEPLSLIWIFALIYALANGLSMFYNLVPGFKTDGYYIVVELVGVESLFARSFYYLRGLIQSVFFDEVEIADQNEPLRVKIILIAYALMLLAFWSIQIPLVVFIVTAGFQDAPFLALFAWYFGIIFLSIKLFQSVGGLGWRFISTILRLGRPTGEDSLSKFNPKAKQLMVATGLILLLLLVPFSRSIVKDGKVIPFSSSLVRAPFESRVDQLLVYDGELVREGQSLVNLVNEPLMAELGRTRELEKAARSSLDSVLAVARENRILKNKRKVESIEASVNFQRVRVKRFKEAYLEGLLPRESWFEEKEKLERLDDKLALYRAEGLVDEAGFDIGEIAKRFSAFRKRSIEVKELEGILQHKTVKADRSGRVVFSSNELERGSFFREGEKILEVVGRDKLVEIVLSEKTLLKIYPGVKIKFFSMVCDEAYEGIIEDLPKVIDRSVRTASEGQRYTKMPLMTQVRVKAKLFDPPCPDARLGTNGKIKFQLGWEPLAFHATRFFSDHFRIKSFEIFPS